MTPRESRVLKGTITLPYQWALGPTNTRFFEEFQNKRIMGTRCQQCGRVLVPARSFCSRCFKDMDEWVQVKDEGTLRTWVLINFPYEGQPKEPPYIIGLIELNGANNGFSHFIGGLKNYRIDFLKERVRIGMRVKAVWKEKREGTIFDIEYFKPTE
ncbi:MAG: Zn-ribbon domain-containing OB-fold protein [Deltaproteobacteria bacterium]|nr:Zn-ribbon domain-containing OB-fold protein [Deltaproteobacteria bacterium]